MPTDKNKKIIDVGCGNGFLLKILLKKGLKNLIRLDIINKINSDKTKFKEGNIEKLPFSNNQFDIVICNHTLKHVLNPIIAVNEIKRICRELVFITVPKQKYYFYTMDLHVNYFPHDYYLTRLMKMDKNICINNDGDWSFLGKI